MLHQEGSELHKVHGGEVGEAFASEAAPPSTKPQLTTPEPQGWKSVKKTLEAGFQLQEILLYFASA